MKSLPDYIQHNPIIPTRAKALGEFFNNASAATRKTKALERMFAKQMNATTISLPSCHASTVSHPNEIAELILNATKGK